MYLIHREERMSNPDISIVARDIMVPLKRLITLRPEMDALVAIRMLLKHRISGAPVIDEDNRYLGVFSEKTSMQFLIRLTYDSLPSSDVRSFMNTESRRTTNPEMDLLSIVGLFMLTPYRRLPVVSDDVLLGQISRRDALSAATKSLDKSSVSGGRQLLYLSALSAHGDQMSTRLS